MTTALLRKIVLPLLFALLMALPFRSYAADPVATAEAAIERFRAACDGEIAKTAPADKAKLIRTMRDSQFLMIARKSHEDIADFTDPKFASAIAKNTLFGLPTALSQSTGDVWVLTYGNMHSMAVYLDATSGAVLCVALIPEG
jgi:hypothetical protein